MKIPLGNLPKIKRIYISPRALKISAIVASSFVVLFLVGGIIAFSKRDAILQAAIENAVQKAKTDSLDLIIKNARFSGIKTLKIEQVSVVPMQRDSLVYLRNLQVSVRLLPLIFGKIKLSEVTLERGKLNLVKKDSLANYDFLFRKKNRNRDTTSRPSLARLADNLLNNFLNKVPDEMRISNFDVQFTDNKSRMRFYVPTARIHNGRLESTILVNNRESTWHIGGDVEPDDKQFDLRLYADGKKVELPVLFRKYHLQLSFDEATVKLRDVDRDGDELKISATWGIRNLLINHPKLAANDIVVPEGSLDAEMLIGENFIALDSSSVIHLKKIEANPYIKYTVSPVKIYELKLHTGELDAGELFASFPRGMFESLEGMRVAGKLQYNLDFKLDSSLPDSAIFHSSLNKIGFRIAGWGKTNLQKINGTFVYTPFEYGKPMRDIVIGPENPEFVPIGSISSNLRNAVLTAEDPTFFSHHGFVELAIRRSIATNFKTKAFKQGGSTISMQLVKNVYLNRQKTLARKIEEMLIVWLIENNGLSNKQRMFETYLNLIEWGPNIYGIAEASHYYFGKYPSDLDLGESIFLASIVPRPKKAMYFFEPDGSLRQGLHGYFRLIGGLMARRGFTGRDSSGSYGFYNVRLREGLRTFISPDSTISDSTLMLQDEDENSDTFLNRMLNRTKEPEKKMDTISIHDLDKMKVVADTVKSRADKRRDRKERKKQDKEAKEAQKRIEKNQLPI